MLTYNDKRVRWEAKLPNGDTVYVRPTKAGLFRPGRVVKMAYGWAHQYLDDCTLLSAATEAARDDARFADRLLWRNNPGATHECWAQGAYTPEGHRLVATLVGCRAERVLVADTGCVVMGPSASELRRIAQQHANPEYT
jgi:hypothetical protein